MTGVRSKGIAAGEKRQGLAKAMLAEGALICRKEKTHIPAGARPAPCLRLLRPQRVIALIRLLLILFPFRFPIRYGRGKPHARPTVRITEDMAFIPIAAEIVPFGFSTLERFIKLVPALNHWLQDWAESPARKPSLSPNWALTIGFGQQTTRDFAKAIFEMLATSKNQTLRVTDLCGHEAILVVPAKAQLRKPPVPNLKQSQHLRVRTVEDVRVATTPGGRKLAVRGNVSSFEEGQTVKIGTKRRHEAVVYVSKHIHSDQGRKP